jgi:UDP-MurNAc hydroxylase
MSSTAARLEWVNHASFVFEHDGVRLIADPWIEGRAFNDGWSLLSDTAFTYDDFRSVTHLWFSHEHPDHFSPPNIRSIPAEIRKTITVLFQHTLDHKVARFCESLGFARVIELRPHRWVELSPRVQVLCHPFPDDDSWIALATDRGTVLNINDCVVDNVAKARAIRKLVGPVRVLMTQFSYAQWPGNPDDIEAQRSEAWEKLHRIRIQAGVFEPEFIIPFASFMWFCHEENFLLNNEMSGVERAAHFIDYNLQGRPVVLYPGDRWEVGQQHDWRPAARRYQRDWQGRMAGGPIVRSRPVAPDELEAAFAAFLRRLHVKNNPLLRYIPVPATSVTLLDLEGSTYRLTLRGMTRIPEPHGGADLATNAENLMYCLRFDWGSNTLHANGRFISPRRSGHERFFRFFRVADDNNHGETVGPVWLASKLASRANRVITGAWNRAMR